MNRPSGDPSRPLWPPIVVGLAAAAAFAYCLSGYAMAQSFMISNPGAYVTNRRAMFIYFGLCVAFFLLFVAALIVYVVRYVRQHRSLARPAA